MGEKALGKAEVFSVDANPIRSAGASGMDRAICMLLLPTVTCILQQGDRHRMVPVHVRKRQS